MLSYDQDKIRYHFKRNLIPVLSHICNFSPILTPEKCTDIQEKFSKGRDISCYLSSEAVEHWKKKLVNWRRVWFWFRALHVRDKARAWTSRVREMRYHFCGQHVN